jgi:hypothetical protein
LIPIEAANDASEPATPQSPASPNLERFLAAGTPVVWRRRSNRAVAQVVLAIMATMALLGLAFALMTTAIRRQHDHPKKTLEPELTRVISIAPARLPAVGYLPADANILVGVHVAELLDDPACKELAAGLSNGSLGFNVNTLTQITGMPLEEIDHAAAAFRLEDRLLPHMTIVVRTRRPYDAGKIRTLLKAGRPLEWKKRTFYRYPLNGGAFEAMVWMADERTLVYGMTREDLEPVPVKPAADNSRFAAPLREALEGQLSPGTQLWAIGHASHWQAGLSWLNTDWSRVLAKLQTFLLSLRAEKEATLTLHVECTDKETARELDESLVSYAAPRLDSSPLWTQIGKTFRHSVDGSNVNAAAVIDSAALRE